MQVEGKTTLPFPKATVFPYLLDQDVLRKSLPGCKSLTEVGPNRYDVEIGLGIAVVRGTYTGSLEVSQIESPDRCHLVIKGEGGPGFVEADLALSLAETSGETELLYSGDAHVGGTIASVGQRVLGGVAKMIIGQFFKGLEEAVRARESKP